MSYFFKIAQKETRPHATGGSLREHPVFSAQVPRRKGGDDRKIRLLFAGYTGGRRPAVQKRGKTELKQPIIACDNFLKLKSKMAPKGDHEVTAEVSEFSLTCVL